MARSKRQREDVESETGADDESSSQVSSDDENFGNVALDDQLSEDEEGNVQPESNADSDSESLLESLDGLSDTSVDSVEYVPGADGKPRPIRPEIVPVYDSDDSDREETNTIGNIPISAYDEMPHIGYDIDGRRIMRPATGSAVDSLLETIEVPEGWTGLVDSSSGKSLNISSEELELIKRLQLGQNPDDSFDPFQDTVEWFTSKPELMPLTAKPEPKRRFVPSKHERVKVMKLVKAIREGKIVSSDSDKKNKEPDQLPLFDLWENAPPPSEDHTLLRAPKLPPPTHAESYNPPPEYLPTEEDAKKWHETFASQRELPFLSTKYDALRKVPAYPEALRERFERCLDLYLAPRVSKPRLETDPDSLVPELPSPEDLRPFPIKCAKIYKGHEGRVRSVSVDSAGHFLATGGDDGTVKIWEVLTGRLLWSIKIANVASTDDSKDRTDKDAVDCVEWNPAVPGLLAAAAGQYVYMLVPPIFDLEIENMAREAVEKGWGTANVKHKKPENLKKIGDDASNGDDEQSSGHTLEAQASKLGKWEKPPKSLAPAALVAIRCVNTVKKVHWHHRGDYFVSVAPRALNKAVIIHQLSKHTSQSPFRKAKGMVQDARFHPFRPHLFVATQRYIRIYDLKAQVLEKRLNPEARWISTFDIHPLGDNVITSTYDKRLTWHDLDLGDKPYKSLRYHTMALRDVAFHKSGLPLFSSASDDGNINVFHGAVYEDLLKNPLLVPLKVLKGHRVVKHLGVLSLAWHPREAWLFSGGADGTARLWVS